MITLGIDLAAQPKTTAACALEWHGGHARVVRLAVGATDELLRELIAPADKVGIDVPFGWPEAFVDAVAEHRHGRGWPDTPIRELRFRRTDLYVQQQTGKWPLSVSTDRIGITAFRAARLLDAYGVDRTGAGLFVEVYPAAALLRFALKPALVDLARSTYAWLDIPDESQALLASNRDAFDALVASLVARASARGLCDPIPPADATAALREGWIALPVTDSLDEVPR